MHQNTPDPTTCYAILPLVPVLLNFFRQARMPADAFLPNKTISRPDMVESINELATNLRNDEQLTITQIKFTYTNKSDPPEPLWSQIVFTILSTCSPPLISPELCNNLLDTYKKNKQEISTNVESCGGLLGPIMDELPRDHFQVLGTFCAFIRDTAEDVVATSRALAKGILQNGKDKEVKDLFLVIVEGAEPIFGRVATAKTQLLG